MNDPDVWAAFESTPAPIEPVERRDNSLQGFQRRLLEECGEKLGETRRHLETAEALLGRAYAIFARMSCGYEARGYGELMVDIDDLREVLRG